MIQSELAQKAIERKLAQTYGVSMASRERQREVDTAAKDWYGVCKACGKRRTGTMAELRRPHDCEVTNG